MFSDLSSNGLENTMTSADTLAVSCSGVVKRFGDVVALDHLELRVDRGRVVGYLGPNGAGKSTTIRILLDLARPDSGEVRVLGLDPRAAGPALRRQIGYLPGELRLDDRLHVDELLSSWATLRGGAVDRAYVGELCERLDLDPTRQTRGLSSGNRRKVGLVGAFMARPDLLVLDEPTAGVDPLVQAEFLRLVDETRDDGRTVFLSSHVLSEVQHIADDVIILRAGRTVASGRLQDLQQSARQPFTVRFANSAPVDELRRLAGVIDVEVDHDVVRGVIEGSPNPLLALLAQHPVEHVRLPEPDLEDAFRRFYEGGGS
jgi:ABC-2 type transport system ATP-binding protein